MGVGGLWVAGDLRLLHSELLAVPFLHWTQLALPSSFQRLTQPVRAVAARQASARAEPSARRLLTVVYAFSLSNSVHSETLISLSGRQDGTRETGTGIRNSGYSVASHSEQGLPPPRS